MPLFSAAPIWLDYGAAASQSLLTNLSAVASVDAILWTASDEGRTIECLVPEGGGYRIARQLNADEIFPNLPGTSDGSELDIESLDIFDGQLWVCGSHCRVRKRASDSTPTVELLVRDRKSRCLLGRATLDASRTGVCGDGACLPTSGIGALRSLLESNPLFAPFSELPSKENGIDIEGLLTWDGRVLFGFRGPVADNMALVVEARITDGLKLRSRGSRVHYLDLHGLGVRDLARHGDDVLVLAGPVTSSAGPFALYAWAPRQEAAIQHPTLLYEFETRNEHPEGVCVLKRDGVNGVLVVFDSPSADRISGGRVRADWLTW